ncbi:hypothetical protein D3C71_1311320 [compost metagenome]
MLDAARQPQQLHARDAQEQAQAIRHGAQVVGGIGLKEEDGQQDFGHAAGKGIAPALVAHHIAGNALQQAIHQEQRAKDHRQHEVPMVMTGQNQTARQQHEQALGVTQDPLAADPGGGDKQGAQSFDDEQDGEGVQGKVGRPVQRINEDDDPGGQEDGSRDGQRAPALAQVLHAQQQQNQLRHGDGPDEDR